MINQDLVTTFNKSVKNTFNVYNSLFLNLPFDKISNVGMLIPLLQEHCRIGLQRGKTPDEILDSFFSLHPELAEPKERTDFMFRVIQYVERQVVLFDSVEDAAFPEIQKQGSFLSLEDFIHIAENRFGPEEVVKKLSEFSARLVFTAHPTQFYPLSVLGIISRLREGIRMNDIQAIDLSLQQLGLTSFINKEKPTPFDEALNILYFFRNVYYDAVGDLYFRIKKCLKNKNFDNPDIIKLGFWPGGDRDGNPFVTAETTERVADELRMSLMKCYYRDIKKLEEKLTFRDVETVIDRVKGEVYQAMFDPDVVLPYEEILNPLIHIRETVNTKYNNLYMEDIENLITRVRIFQTHFGVLDIRQDHSIHIKAMDAILKQAGLVKKSYTELNRDALISILLDKDLEIEEEDFSDEVVKDTIRTLRLLPKIQEKNGETGCNRYIISNSTDIFSVLFVYAFFRWTHPGKDIPFDVVPLFETMEGMEEAESVMIDLFGMPRYREHIRQRKDRQTIMLGFSDGTKDGGYMTANWAIFKTKEVLSKVCQEHGIKAIFFDGRGGPPARGGGKTHRFYAAQSPDTAKHEIQLTVQGQTISSKYGTPDHFMFHCEQLITAGLSNNFSLSDTEIPAPERKLLGQLSQLSFEKYKALKEHPSFLSYLEKKSTLRYYGKANIGSRPAKRGQKKKLELQDLRAISFVGSWSQLKQNVPGYFGIGSALQKLIDEGKLEDLKSLFREVPFFKALIMNSMMAVSKSNFALTAYITQDPEYSEFWNLLHDEYILSRDMMLKISGYQQLMEEEPVTRNSVAMREQLVLPLLTVQQYALQKVEKDTPDKDIYEKMVQRSLYGNINASRNSA